MKKYVGILYLAGVIAPILFAIITVLGGTISSDYSHTHQFISELGAEGAETQAMMNLLGFLPTGSLVMLFSWALYVRKTIIIGKVGTIFIGIFGLGVTLSGIFPCDIGCPIEGTLTNNIHQTIAPIAFVSVCLGILLTGLAFRKNPYVEEFWMFTIYSSIIAIVFLFLLVLSLGSRMYTGLMQRWFLGTVFLWMAICGYVLFQKSKNQKQTKNAT